MNKHNDNKYNLDRFDSDFHEYRFPDQQEKEVAEYSTCSGCGKGVDLNDVVEGEVLDVYGMCVHNDIVCIRDAVQARVVTLDDIID